MMFFFILLPTHARFRKVLHELVIMAIGNGETEAMNITVIEFFDVFHSFRFVSSHFECISDQIFSISPLPVSGRWEGSWTK